MKYSIAVITIFVFLSSCQSGTSVNKAAKTDTTKQVNDQLITTFRSLLKGTWIKASYIDDLVKTKSGAGLQDKHGFVLMLLADSASNNDSVHIQYGNFHEGSEGMDVYFKPGTGANTLQMNMINSLADSGYYELGYEVNNKDTALVIYHYKKDKTLSGKDIYLSEPDKASAFTNQSLVNKVLFSGKYKSVDSKDKTEIVVFTDDGAVTGMQRLSKYIINLDHYGGPEPVYDEVFMTGDSDIEARFGFKIKGDSLLLYKGSKDGDKHPKLAYSLVREK